MSTGDVHWQKKVFLKIARLFSTGEIINGSKVTSLIYMRPIMVPKALRFLPLISYDRHRFFREHNRHGIRWVSALDLVSCWNWPHFCPIL